MEGGLTTGSGRDHNESWIDKMIGVFPDSTFLLHCFPGKEADFRLNDWF